MAPSIALIAETISLYRLAASLNRETTSIVSTIPPCCIMIGPKPISNRFSSHISTSFSPVVSPPFSSAILLINLPSSSTKSVSPSEIKIIVTLFFICPKYLAVSGSSNILTTAGLASPLRIFRTTSNATPMDGKANDCFIVRSGKG